MLKVHLETIDRFLTGASRRDARRPVDRLGTASETGNARPGHMSDGLKRRSIQLYLTQKGCCMTMPAIVSKDRYPVTHTEESRWSRELVKLIAKDVGDAVVTHIETMYPAAFAATPGTFPLSVRNCAL